MSSPQKDIKILWAKAAGRCAMLGCRAHLVLASSPDVPSANVLVGEGCHIVAEEEKGPRGLSSLSLTDRNRYPNLILLCRNHHAVIDGDVEAWPIERLHQLKADHELWVETQLVDESEIAGDAVYSALISSAVDAKNDLGQLRRGFEEQPALDGAGGDLDERTGGDEAERPGHE
jgi:hypothetical protein